MTICGLDEAGRGAFAGPLVAAAVIGKISRIKDGKLLTAQKREQIYKRLKKTMAEIFIEIISVEEINKFGIGWANITAFERLVTRVKADRFIVDGNLKIKGTESMVHADALIPEVILAGIVAKVERDKLMLVLDKLRPEFNWKINKGYGTKDHRDKIKELGITKYHRVVFVNTSMLPATRRAAAAGRPSTKSPKTRSSASTTKSSPPTT